MTDFVAGKFPEVNPWMISGPGVFIPADPFIAENSIFSDEILKKVTELGIPVFLIRPDMRKPLPLLQYDPEASGSLGSVGVDELDRHLEAFPVSNTTRQNARIGVFQLHSIAQKRRADRAFIEHRYAEFRADDTPVEPRDEQYVKGLRSSLERELEESRLEPYENPILVVEDKAGGRKPWEESGTPMIDLDKLLLFFQHRIFDSNHTMLRQRYKRGVGPVTRYILTHFMNSRIAAALAE